MNVRIVRLVVVLAVAVVSGACSSDNSAGPTTTTTSATTTSTAKVTTTTTAAPDCTVDPVLVEADATLELVGLVPGGDWVADSKGSPFAERTVSPDQYRKDLALDCRTEMSQTTDAGAERLLLAAWTGERIVFVLQATDAPKTPFQTQAVFDLLLDQPTGQYFAGPYRANRDDQTTWAGTLDGGDSVVIFAHDYAAGPVAKTWQEGFETSGEDDYVTLDSERYGMERLRAAGARNVSIAELPETGSPIGTLQFVTPLGQGITTRVAPTGIIDPTTEWHQRPVTSEEVDGVTVYLSVAGPPDDDNILTYDVAHMTFDCGTWTWHVMTEIGTPAELEAWVQSFIPTLHC